MPPQTTDPWKMALAALSRRDLTAAEIRRKLTRKKVTKDSVERVLARLAERGYVDDRNVAYNHARLRAEQGRRGPRRVRAEMIARGLPPALVDEVLREAFPSAEDGPALARAVSKICGPAGPPEAREERERLARKLIRAGFAPGAVLDWLHRSGSDEDFHDEIS
ncbi:MAG: RecX family transcriptional regulator [Acidobacteriota bacterium]|nr:RecX family transcriptional regulator [Acidobacteriota bacterium]